MSAINIIGILTVTQGQEEKFRETMKTALRNIHSKEEGSCLRFLVTEDINPEDGSARFVLVETYRDMKAVEIHENSEHYKAFFKTMTDEGLVSGTPMIVKSKGVMGFDLDRKLTT